MSHFDMTQSDAHRLYSTLRGDLLRATRHHRRATRHPDIADNVHKLHLRTCQRQLGALRQAYRRTQEAIVWETYRKTWDTPQQA